MAKATVKAAKTGVEQLIIEDFADAATHDDRIKRIVFLIHGIRSAGDWFRVIDMVNTDYGAEYGLEFDIRSLSYSRYSTLPFIFSLGRKKNAAAILEQMRHIMNKASTDVTFDVVAHSNGVKLLSEIALEIPIKFRRIILLGSIAKNQDIFNLRRNIADDSITANSILNDASAGDYLPGIAAALRPDLFEDTGFRGAFNGVTINRFFTFGHGGGLKRAHIEKALMPFLRSGLITKDENASPNTTVWNPAYIRYYLIALLALAVMFFAKI